MGTRLNVCHICLLLVSILTTTFQDVKATGRAQKGPGNPHNCIATAFSSTAVLLTWNSATDREINNPRHFSIYYRPLYSMGNFTTLHAGKELYYLVENLDVVTYYSFRIVANDSSGTDLTLCEVLAKTLKDARLSVPMRLYQGGSKGLRVNWKAVTLPEDPQPIYRLFLEWRRKGKLHVWLLYEGKNTSAVIKRKLPSPNRMYISVVIKKQQIRHQAANILTYPTKQVSIPATHFKYQAANILTYPTTQALIPATHFKPYSSANARNKTLLFRVSIDDYGWNFVRISWNNIKVERSHVTYQISCRSGGMVTKSMTSDTSALLSGLNQLTRYQITVDARENNATLLLLSAETHLTTSDKDECSAVPNPCLDPHSECVNTRGSYFCRCLLGWTGDGQSCKEVADKKENLSYCDKHTYVNITWSMTLQGQTALAQCPGATSRGVAKRTCLEASDGGAKWAVPDLSQCVSDKMVDIAQQLKNPTADFTGIAEQLVNVTSVDTNAQTSLQTGDLRLAVDVIMKISQKTLDNVHNYPSALRNDQIRKITQAVVKSSSNILDNKTLESWTFMPKDSIAAEASKLLKGVDAIGLNLAKAAISSDAILYEAPNVVLSAKSTEKVNPTDQQMPPKTKSMRKGSSSSVVLPGSVVKLQQNEANQNQTQYITFVAYRNLKALMQPSNGENPAEPTTDRSDVGRIDSEVVSVSIYPMNINSFKEPVTLILKNTQDSDNDQASCVFWNTTSARGFWSEAGCHMTNTNSSHTTCQCYHLTSFAVLMRVKHIQNNAAMKEHSFVLSLISYIGISISIVALCLSFLTFTFLRFRNTRHRYFVHANLALSLGLAETLFLFGITKTTDKIVCKTIAITLHYLFLVSFSWMALEGVVLYLMLVKIFRSKARPARDRIVFLLCGWGIPAIIVAGSAVLFHEGYGTKDFCWLSFEKHFTWAFVGPVLLVCLFNFICLGKTFMIMSSRGSTKKSDTSVEKIRYWCKGCALLSCLLGLTWIVGVFVVNEETIFMAYLFNIFNTLQGLLIFVFHCIGDEKVRAEYLRIIRCQTRAMAYGAARPWWSKSDSISRSRMSEKLRRNTMHSNMDSPKVTIDGSVQRGSGVMTGPEYTALRRSINRPMKMSQMYGITEDASQQNNEERLTESRPTSQKAESLTNSQNKLDSDGNECLKNSEEITTNTELVKTGLTCTCELNLPDVIKKDCGDIDETRKESATLTTAGNSMKECNVQPNPDKRD